MTSHSFIYGIVIAPTITTLHSMHIEETRGLKQYGIGWASIIHSSSKQEVSSIFHRAEKLTWMTSFKQLWLSSSQHALHAFCNLCTCYTCRVVNECKVFGNEGAVGSAPGAVEMERKWRDVSRPKLVSLLCSNEFVERRKEEIWIDSLFVNDWCEENQICT